MDDGEAARIREVMDTRGIGVSELFVCDFGQAINHPDAKERERSRELFAKFAAIGGDEEGHRGGHGRLGPRLSHRSSSPSPKP